MLERHVANVIWFGIGLVLLCLVVRVVVMPTIRDTLRSRLLSVRRDMYLFMARGGVSVQHLAYRHARSVINTAILHADSISLSRTVAGILFVPRLKHDGSDEIEAAVESLPPRAREKIEHYRQRAGTLIIGYALMSSTLGWLLIAAGIPVIGSFCIVGFLRSATSRYRSAMLRVLTRQAEHETQIIKCITRDEELPAAA